MATKYNRESEVSERVEARRTPWMRQGTPPGRMSRRQRLFVIFLGLMSLGLLSQLAYRLNRDSGYTLQPVKRGVGVIVAREEADVNAELATVRVEMPVGNPGPLVATCEIPAPYWQNLSVGDRLAVLYRLSKTQQEIQVVECGMVALSE